MEEKNCSMCNHSQVCIIFNTVFKHHLFDTNSVFYNDDFTKVFKALAETCSIKKEFSK